VISAEDQISYRTTKSVVSNLSSTGLFRQTLKWWSNVPKRKMQHMFLSATDTQSNALAEGRQYDRALL